MPNIQGFRTISGQNRLFDSVLETVGNTPCIRVNNLAPDGVTLYVKAEFLIQGALYKID